MQPESSKELVVLASVAILGFAPLLFFPDFYVF
jgi:hypothetical protein